MKKIKDIYPEIISKENLYRSAHRASLGRRYGDTVADFNFHLEEEVETLHGELTGKTYRHGKYRMFTIYDPKERNIAAAPFRDRVVHHAVHDVIEPFIDKTFIYDSYACRENKGTHKAVDRAQSFLRANRFCFHGDVKKYFPSIDHGVLKEMLAKRIMDRDVLWLVNGIIDSARQIIGDNKQCARHCEKPQVTKSACPAGSPKERDCFVGLRPPHRDEGSGLPIGSLTSQFFANLYLNELDYFVKFDLRCRYYLRYMDDFLIFSNAKEDVLEVKTRIRDFLKNRLALQMHEGKSQVYKTENGIKFLGFRIYKDYRRLASDNVKRFRKRLKNFAYNIENGKIDAKKISDSVRCWTAHSGYANTGGLRYKILNSLEHSQLGGLLKDVLLMRKEAHCMMLKHQLLAERSIGKKPETAPRKSILLCHFNGFEL